MVAHQPHADDARILHGRLLDDLPGSIAETVIDQDQLAGPAQRIQHSPDPAQKQRQRVFLVEARRNHRDCRATHAAVMSANVNSHVRFAPVFWQRSREGFNEP